MKLEIGHTTRFSVRDEKLNVSKGRECKILHISDLHLNKHSQKKVELIIESIKSISPDIVLLGGDYIDSKRGVIFFDHLINGLSMIENVVMIPGNHDFYFGIEKIKSKAEKNNLHWLQNGEIVLEVNGTNFIITDQSNFTENKNTIKIALVHKPKAIEGINGKFDLAFAGHLHGAQFVFWQKKQSLYPGRLFYKYNRLKMKTKGLTYFINKGLGDTLPIRYNCTKEMILVSLNQ